MRRLAIALITIATVPMLSAGSRHNYDNGHRGMNITSSVDEWSELDSCDQIKVTIDGEPALRAEQELPVEGLRSLKVRSDQNGGIHVVGGASRFGVTACKAAAFDSQLRDINVRMSGNEVRSDGPDGGNWTVYFLVRVPRGGTIDLEAHNGPISVTHVDGNVTARAMNGPISLKESTGTIDADTTNGPISISGDSGNVKLNAQNGPISVRLDGSSWNGSLDARTQNGPLSVKISNHFRSGVVIESDGHGPISCKAAACRDSRRTWDDDDNRKIELGSGPVNVHMSTTNGPISVKEQE